MNAGEGREARGEAGGTADRYAGPPFLTRFIIKLSMIFLIENRFPSSVQWLPKLKRGFRFKDEIILG